MTALQRYDWTKVKMKIDHAVSPPLLAGLKSILDVSYKKLRELPELDNNLEKLSCEQNNLTSLPKLPDNLKYLHCSGNKLTSLPNLPDGLLYLFCYNNQLTSLPNLPDGLLYLYCHINQLTSLPKLPDGLLYLDCGENQLTSLPNLPNSLLGLFCGKNQLTSLPKLPDDISYLECHNNPISVIPNVEKNIKLRAIDFCDTKIKTIPKLPASLGILTEDNKRTIWFDNNDLDEPYKSYYNLFFHRLINWGADRQTATQIFLKHIKNYDLKLQANNTNNTVRKNNDGPPLNAPPEVLPPLVEPPPPTANNNKGRILTDFGREMNIVIENKYGRSKLLPSFEPRSPLSPPGNRFTPEEEAEILKPNVGYRKNRKSRKPRKNRKNRKSRKSRKTRRT